jgi:hypothetical protein
MEQVYNLYDRLSERRDALARWARFIVSLSEGGGNVVQFVCKDAAER